MITNKISSDRQKTIELILVLLSALVVFVAFRVFVQPLQEKTDAIDVQNNILKNKIRDLEGKIDRMEEFEQTALKCEEETAVILSTYPAGVSAEKDIVVLNKIEKATGIRFYNTSFGGTNTLYTDSEGEYICMSHSVTVNYEATYAEYKSFNDYVNSYPERINVRSFTANFDQESGNLSGSVILDLFYILGGDREYTVDPITGAPVGTDNIFGTIEE